MISLFFLQGRVAREEGGDRRNLALHIATAYEFQ